MISYLDNTTYTHSASTSFVCHGSLPELAPRVAARACGASPLRSPLVYLTGAVAWALLIKPQHPIIALSFSTLRQHSHCTVTLSCTLFLVVILLSLFDTLDLCSRAY
jgi:hypothetical protein